MNVSNLISTHCLSSLVGCAALVQTKLPEDMLREIHEFCHPTKEDKQRARRRDWDDRIEALSHSLRPKCIASVHSAANNTITVTAQLRTMINEIAINELEEFTLEIDIRLMSQLIHAELIEFQFVVEFTPFSTICRVISIDRMQESLFHSKCVRFSSK